MVTAHYANYEVICYNGRHNQVIGCMAMFTGDCHRYKHPPWEGPDWMCLSGARTQEAMTPVSVEVMPTSVTYQVYTCAHIHEM